MMKSFPGTGSWHRLLRDSHLPLVHALVIGLSLMMTLGAYVYASAQTDTRIENAFKAARDQAAGLISARMEKYEDALWAGVSAVQSHGGDMTYRQWKAFARALRVDQRYPGINGIGIIHHVGPGQYDTYLRTRRSERPEFSVYPAHDNSVRLPISFIEPEDMNAAAVGLDVAHESNRRKAALASSTTGEARITAPIVLVQDESSTPGFLFYAPFYSGSDTAGRHEREQSFDGLVYAPFVVRKLMAGLLSKELRNVRFSISDQGQLIYNEHDPEDPQHDPAPKFTETVELEVYGRTWTIDFRTTLGFRQAHSYSQPTLILIGGLVIEALVISLLFMMARSSQRARAYAARVTTDLQEKSVKLEKANEELEQFVYITSHDLKTPVRSIGTLTEMIQEDLEDYFRSADADPEVAANLARISERVDRMNELTQGVMEYARTGEHSSEDKPLCLGRMAETLRSDFGLAGSQLELHGNVAQIAADTFNFARVVENLVGNAVKYHPSPDTAKITVRVEDAGLRYDVSVRDNGAGIAPEYHRKIFEVFQTLRCPGQPESTGIGLAIVKKSVERHGFEVTLHSDTGKGADFRFSWPKAGAAPQAQAA
ncbi:CHASE domain-containing protein [Leisingera daeponensis]|uniref:CHASE domain-containing protein n=1 Tax=Leisingera daeponensis TaxID=405746 RepID=UPI001C9419D9|nr:CHASE domain-containing protein [Leisingera daeponensis]MBY6054863.1 CHASE domain-containing protein [Leisingera daeponensis]